MTEDKTHPADVAPSAALLRLFGLATKVSCMNTENQFYIQRYELPCLCRLRVQWEIPLTPPLLSVHLHISCAFRLVRRRGTEGLFFACELKRWRLRAGHIVGLVLEGGEIVCGGGRAYEPLLWRSSMTQSDVMH